MTFRICKNGFAESAKQFQNLQKVKRKRLVAKSAIFTESAKLLSGFAKPLFWGF
jgi:hypothetical protein